MSNNSPKKFVVARKYYDTSSFDTLDEAIAAARTKTWESGEETGVYTLVAVASAAEMVNTVKVTNVQ